MGEGEGPTGAKQVTRFGVTDGCLGEVIDVWCLLPLYASPRKEALTAA